MPQQGESEQNLPPPSPSIKRSLPPNSPTSPAKKQSKWTPEEDRKIIELRGMGWKWDDISKELPGRSAISCRLHYQNYLERRSEWSEEKKDRLARLYERYDISSIISSSSLQLSQDELLYYSQFYYTHPCIIVVPSFPVPTRRCFR